MRRSEFADYPFDKERFQEVITKARGERSQMDFSKDCGLSYAYLNKYANGKINDTPTIQTLRKIAVAASGVTYEDLLSAAGYDPNKYKYDKPVGSTRKDFLYPIFIGMANSDYNWRIESGGYGTDKPFEILIENEDVGRWFFIPVMKKEVEKEDISGELFQTLGIPANSKVSFITDNKDVYEALKELEFPLLSLYMSVIKIYGRVVEEETSINTAVKTDITICNADVIRPFTIG